VAIGYLSGCGAGRPVHAARTVSKAKRSTHTQRRSRGAHFRKSVPATRKTWQILRMSSRMVVLAVLGLTSTAAAEPAPREFLAEAKTLLVVGACAPGTVTDVKPEIVDRHCKAVRAAQEQYKTKWLAAAGLWFAANVPKDVPKTVVYPFAGGDLATALAVYPDADEITTLSLEPAGDPLAIGKLSEKELTNALAIVEKELGSLYRYNFSVTTNMIEAMRGGKLPTQLIFSLSALVIHGYEPIAMRYFQLADDGQVHYLMQTDVDELEKLKGVGERNKAFANVEIRFKKPNGREQIYRHILANLDDNHLKKTPAALRYLEAKGHVAAMTKAASYLLTFDEFSTMRQYIVDHVEWMVSDSTGLPPNVGSKAGFEYETWGTYELSNMKEGKSVTPQWRALYAAQPERALAFRFGYPDGKWRGHLIVMRRPVKH
jgi:hypothetical protein